MKQKRIAILTLNPGIDRVIYLDGKLNVGGHNRSSRVVINQGSKGANQAIMLKNLGCDPEYFSFTGGPYAALCESFTDSYGITSHYVKTECGVRLNVKVIDADGQGTELNENGGPVKKDELDRLLNELLSGDYDVISLCGSFPQGVEKGVYKSLIAQLHALDISCVADASGEPLSLAVQAKPSLIKPNLEEFCATFAQKISMCKTVENACNAVHDAYLRTGVQILCSMDKHGAIYAGSEGIYTVQSPVVEQIGSFAGAGDTLLAAFLYARMLCAAPIADALRFASASATAKVRLPAGMLPTKEQICTEWIQTNVKKGGA